VYLNRELHFGQGEGKDKIIMPEGTPLTVVAGLIGFFNYFLDVTAADGKLYHLKIESLERKTA
jgi:hypothetical protein